MAENEDLVESGYVLISRGIYRLLQEGNHEKAYEDLGIVLRLIQEDRANLRLQFPGLRD
jgi:hypothetical protein